MLRKLFCSIIILLLSNPHVFADSRTLNDSTRRDTTYKEIFICGKTSLSSNYVISINRDEFINCDRRIRTQDSNYVVKQFQLVLLYRDKNHEEIQIKGSKIPDEYLDALINKCRAFYIEKAIAEDKQHKVMKLLAANVIIK